MARRPSAFARLVEHFHTHPRGRLHEILFWGGIGLGMGALALALWMRGAMSTPLALMMGIVALCFVGFALLPQKRASPKRPPAPGKRGEIAQKVRASKAERKNKGPPPPGPPIRRG